MIQNMSLKFLDFCELTDWSVAPFFSKMHSSIYSLCPLKKCLKRVKEKVEIKDEVEYKQITVRLYGQGVLQRGFRMGKDIGTKTQFVAHTGQLIVSRIDARNGAFGIVPDFLDGAIVTNDFWLFDVCNASAEYLALLLSSKLFQKQLQVLSTGTTNRQRVSEADFLACRVPMPEPIQQDYLVSRYREYIDLADKKLEKVEEYKKDISCFLMRKLGIFEKNTQVTDSFLSFNMFSAMEYWGVDKNVDGIERYYSFMMPANPVLKNKEYVRAVFRGKSPFYKDGTNQVVLNQKCNRWNHIDEQFAKTVDNDWYDSLDSEIFLKKNDIIINSTGEGTLGRASLVTASHEGYLVDSHILVLRLNEDYLSPEFLVRQINSTFGQKQVDLLKGAQATKQTELGVENLRKMRFVIPMDEKGKPELSIQKRIVCEVKEIEEKINILLSESQNLKLQAIKKFENSIFR